MKSLVELISIWFRMFRRKNATHAMSVIGNEFIDVKTSS